MIKRKYYFILLIVSFSVVCFGDFLFSQILSSSPNNLNFTLPSKSEETSHCDHFEDISPSLPFHPQLTATQSNGVLQIPMNASFPQFKMFHYPNFASLPFSIPPIPQLSTDERDIFNKIKASPNATQGHDLCWGPCKQALYEKYLASGAGLAIASIAAMDPSDFEIENAMKNIKPVVQTEPERIIISSTLKALLKSATSFTLLDARTGRLDDGRRILGAKHSDDYSDIQKIQTIVPSFQEMIVVYGNDSDCPSRSELVKNLKHFGYINIIEYKDGLKGWASAGYEIIEKK